MRIVAAADALGDTGGAGSDGVGKELPVITRGERKRETCQVMGKYLQRWAIPDIM